MEYWKAVGHDALFAVGALWRYLPQSPYPTFHLKILDVSLNWVNIFTSLRV